MKDKKKAPKKENQKDSKRFDKKDKQNDRSKDNKRPNDNASDKRPTLYGPHLMGNKPGRVRGNEK